jgi:hypothetical protein
MTKTGFCNCLRPGEGDNNINGPHGCLGLCEIISEIAKLALDPSGKSVA